MSYTRCQGAVSVDGEAVVVLDIASSQLILTSIVATTEPPMLAVGPFYIRDKDIPSSESILRRHCNMADRMNQHGARNMHQHSIRADRFRKHGSRIFELAGTERDYNNTAYDCAKWRELRHEIIQTYQLFGKLQTLEEWYQKKRIEEELLKLVLEGLPRRRVTYQR
ncbi:hypothetical protein FQN57_000033 [Myotisia sp. PD_48]|nr:hypothetical protein FQN57_000033 [Myotisia sp. PD_48]